jgi:hypothetical protein
LLNNEDLRSIFELNPKHKEKINNDTAYFAFLKGEFIRFLQTAESPKRLEYLAIFLGSIDEISTSGYHALSKIGKKLFYQVEFNERFKLYNFAFNEIESKYGSFLDGYLRSWDFMLKFISNSKQNETYINIVSSYISKFEKIILYYYCISGYSGDKFDSKLLEYNLLENMYQYHKFIIHEPSKLDIENELKSIQMDKLKTQIFTGYN